MKKKKPLLKTNKVFRFVASHIVAPLLVVASATSVYNNVKLANYSTDDQVTYISQQLEGDMDIFKQQGGHYLRMQHNNGKPILVYLDESLSQEQKDATIKSLDYVFGIVGAINSNYKYKIVDKTEFNLAVGQSRIFYESKDIKPNERYQDPTKVGGKTYRFLNFGSALTQVRTLSTFKIIFNNIENQLPLDYTAVHELLHAFGLNDVYTSGKDKMTDKHYCNTIMNVDNCHNTSKIHPSDLKVLISAYAELFSDEDTQKEEMQRLQNLYDEYEKEYYSEVIKDFKGSKETQDVEKQKLQFQGVRQFFNQSNTAIVSLIYKVEIENDSYKFQIVDHLTGETLSSSTGNVLWQDGVAVLRDVHLECGLSPGFASETVYKDGEIMDLFITKERDKVCFYDNLTNLSVYENQNIDVLEDEKE